MLVLKLKVKMCKIIIWLITIVNEVSPMDPITVDLATPAKQSGEACGYEACPPFKQDMVNVHIVPHTHLEVGGGNTFHQHYTGTDRDVATRHKNVKRILDYTISELWAYADRKFTFSDMPYFFHWWANRDGTVRRMVYQLLRQGRLYFVGGGWSMVDEATTNYHAVVDSFTYSLRKINATFLRCGLPLVTWQSESFGHSREVASLLAQMGFDGHFISPISFDDELARMNRKAMEFLWRGSDDIGVETDIFTHKLFDGYWSPPGFCFGMDCNDPLLVTSDSMFKNIDDRVDVFIKLMQHRQSPYYSTNNVMVMMGQRMGYHDASIWFANVDKLISEVNKKSYESGAKLNLFYSTPACYLKAVRRENPQLEVKQDDFVPLAYDKFTHMTGMFTSRPPVKLLAREGHLFLMISRQLQVLARLWKNDGIFENFAWIVSIFQDHSVIAGAMREHVADYYVEKMALMIQKSMLVLKQAFNKLRKCSLFTIYHNCNFNISSCNSTESATYFIMIYNPLAWNVSIPVRVPIQNYEYIVTGPKLEVMNTSVVKIPQPILDLSYRKALAQLELVFIATDIPPLGYKSYLFERVSREKRSIIKKIKNTNKKYLIRQTSHMDDESLLNAQEDYNYAEDVTTDKPGTKIEFANITNLDAKDVGMILTPKPKIEFTTSAPVETTIVKEDAYYQYEEVTTIPETTTPKPTTTTKKIERIKVDINKFVPEESKDLFISNKYIRVDLDSDRKVSKLSLSNGISTALDIQFYFYVSDEPEKMFRSDKKTPGSYIFRPIDSKPEPIMDFFDTVVYKTKVVEEIHTRYANYASFAIKLYVDLPYVVVDWVVGPIPGVKSETDFGRDVFIRYTTNLVNEGIFYTDSNGRQTIKRIRNIRPLYEPANMDPIPGNFYPVTSKIHIEDVQKNIRFSVFNDRSQGGTSLTDGEIDLMLHRKILTDDTGTYTHLNESEYDQPITVRGQHVLYLSKADYKQNKIYEKILAKELYYTPRVFVSRESPFGYYTRSRWWKQNNIFTALKTKLPLGVHILTLQEWNDGTLLLRLENYLEKSDTLKSGRKTVFLKDLLVNLKITEVKETTLSAHMWLKDWSPLIWSKKTKFVKNFNDFYGDFNGTAQYCDDEEVKPYEEVDLEKGIVLSPQQIRTFVVWFKYVNIKIGNVL